MLRQQNRARERDGEGEQSGEFLHLRSLPPNQLLRRGGARSFAALLKIRPPVEIKSVRPSEGTRGL